MTVVLARPDAQPIAFDGETEERGDGDLAEPLCRDGRPILAALDERDWLRWAAFQAERQGDVN